MKEIGGSGGEMVGSEGDQVENKSRHHTHQSHSFIQRDVYNYNMIFFSVRIIQSFLSN
jgi:hypothetical protein